MYILKYANKLLTIAQLRRIYYERVHPHFLYAITIWGSHDPNKAYLHPLIRTQKRIIRTIYRVPPRAHSIPLLTNLGILTITNLYILRVSVDMHPFIHPSTAQNRPEHIHQYNSTASAHSHSTRNSVQSKFLVHIPKTMPYFTAKYARIWNSLDLTIRQIESPNLFKQTLKTTLLIRQTDS